MSAVDTLTRELERIAGRVEQARPRFDVEPLPLVSPATVEQVCELLRFASRDALRVIPVGLGSKLGHCATPGHVDFLLSTRALTGATSHVPDDGTISVRAGTRMAAALADTARGGGHFLTPDVAAPHAKTIGGVVAAGESGFDRLRFGPTRHHVLGTKVVLADGTLAKSGGQLVKNVTGFDLHRLHTGSHGTLCVIVEVSLRLFPEPEHESWIAANADDEASAFELGRRALALPIRLVSLSLAPRDGSMWTAFARLFGRRETVEAERVALESVWPGSIVLTDARARAAANQMRDALSFAGSARPRLHATCAPSRCERAFEMLAHVLEEARVERRFALQPGVAEIEVELHSGVEDAGTLAQLVETARTALAPLGATLDVRNAPRAALVALDPFATPSAGLELMRALRARLDPQGVFATGRFAGGL